MVFEQASIKVEKTHEFRALQAAIEEAFRAETVESFLKHLDAKGIRVRDLDGVLAKRILEESGTANAHQLYQALTTSDQAQLREFYLSKIEEVDPALRHRFKKLYQYY